MTKKWWAKVLRITGIVMMAVTAAFTMLGGIGTTCVALNPGGFGGGFSGIAPYQWLYLTFVLVTFAFGVMGVRAVVLLIRNRPNAYRYSIIALIGGTLVNLIHVIASRSLRGSSMPVDMVLYVNILTLLLFFVLRIPGIWKEVGFGQPVPSNITGVASGLASITIGTIALTIQLWMGSTHTIGGVNYADAWHWHLQVIGWLLVIAGFVTLAQNMGVSAGKEPAARSLRALD